MQHVDELYTAFQTLVRVASGVEQVILANQGRPAPPGLHATYNPVPVRAVGHPRRQRADVPAQDCDIPDWTDFEETTVSQMDFLLSVNFFNEGARDAAWRMHNANFRAPVQELLFTHGIGWRTCSEVRSLTELSQGGLQPRYQVDVRLYVEAEVTDIVLRAAGFALVMHDEDGNLIYGAS